MVCSYQEVLRRAHRDLELRYILSHLTPHNALNLFLDSAFLLSSPILLTDTQGGLLPGYFSINVMNPVLISPLAYHVLEASYKVFTLKVDLFSI